jgi:hypothetical protein
MIIDEGTRDFLKRKYPMGLIHDSNTNVWYTHDFVLDVPGIRTFVYSSSYTKPEPWTGLSIISVQGGLEDITKLIERWTNMLPEIWTYRLIGEVTGTHQPAEPGSARLGAMTPLQLRSASALSAVDERKDTL